MKRLLDLASDACLSLASLALVVLVATFGWLVFGRYVLNSTPTWVEQLALLLIVFITFLGAATGVHEDTHLGVSFMREALPGKLRHAVRLVADLAVCGFGIVMFLSGVELANFAWGSTMPMLGIPEGVRSVPAATCGALMAAFAGYRAVLDALALAGRGHGPGGVATEVPVHDGRPDVGAAIDAAGGPPPGSPSGSASGPGRVASKDAR